MFTNKTGNFQNPFSSISNNYLPQDIKEAFSLCEWMYRFDGIFAAAIERIARLFLTGFKYGSAQGTVAYKKVRDYLEGVNGIKQKIISIGIDYLLYKNCFILLYFPFKRWLTCKACNNSFSIYTIEDVVYHADDYFEGKCPICEKNQQFSYKDVEEKDISKINIIRIPPLEICQNIIHNKFSGKSTYVWAFSSDTIDKIKKGKGTLLQAETPIEILQAVYQQKSLKIEEDSILHIKGNNIAGFDYDFAMPTCLTCFPIIFYIAILRKANEAISMDYIIPIRLLFPQNNTSFQEAGFMAQSKWASRVREIIEEHKQDPISWHTSPMPIGYQVIGGDKRAFMLSDEIRISREELLNSIGFSPEFFYGTLNLQASPMALRLLENTHGLTEVYNIFLRWFLAKICAFLSIEQIDVSVIPLRWMDDIEKRNIIGQLASVQQISPITLFDAYGLDFEEEQRKQIQGQEIMARIQEEAKKKKIMDEQNQTGPQSSGSPMDIMAQAESMAQQLITLPEEQRRIELNKIMQQNPLLHDAVMGSMERARNQLRTQGMHMMLQQGG